MSARTSAAALAAALAAMALATGCTPKVDLRKASYDQYMTELSKKAVERATRDIKVPLALNEASMRKDLEEILDRLSKEHRQKALPRQRLFDEGEMWGAYVGEIVRKKHPGAAWSTSSKKASLAKVYPLILPDGTELFPVAWVRSRIESGVPNYASIRYDEALRALARSKDEAPTKPKP